MKEIKIDDHDSELETLYDNPNPNSPTKNVHFHTPNSINDDESSIDDLLKSSTTCTHTHTCNNPPCPDSAHTHTCFHTHTHTHTQLLELPEKTPSNPSPNRPLGNREAVKKYREKKKAHAAFLEEEVMRLRTSNEQLARRLKRQRVVEAEVLRLRGLLVDLRGTIDKELGDFPYQKQCGIGFRANGNEISSSVVSEMQPK